MISRRALMAAAGTAALAACSHDDRVGDLGLATGGEQGVYRRLGDALAAVWGDEDGQPTRVLGSEGSVQNVDLLRSGAAGVAFCAVDVAADALTDPTRALDALARVHDDAVHLVVPAESPVRRLADLRGRRVSVGAPSSGVLVITPRLLATAGLDAARDLTAVPLGLDDSIGALARGDIDAFLWSGGVPTSGVADLSAARPIRLVDLADEVLALRRDHPVYDLTAVPAGTYGLTAPVTVPSVRNLLLAAGTLPTALAEDLTRTLLDHRDTLAAADPAGRAIDPRAAIATEPAPLHPGAVRAYRHLKGI